MFSYTVFDSKQLFSSKIVVEEFYPAVADVNIWHKAYEVTAP